MKSYEIIRGFSKISELMQQFTNGELEQEGFCDLVQEITEPLMTNGKLGVRGILKSYSSIKEKVQAVIHEGLHRIVNKLTGIPSGAIGAITEEDTSLVWGLTFMDIETARKTPKLRDKLIRAQKLHNFIERLNI